MKRVRSKKHKLVEGDSAIILRTTHHFTEGEEVIIVKKVIEGYKVRRPTDEPGYWKYADETLITWKEPKSQSET